ncbi:2-hydroxyacid dehydrogenase [Staphylococcus pasteuri]|uniref:2-hydroxyacid dehydrogenase n=1 Tax=Staphylococcus TaxID=1279 RepID=UPI0012B700E7|nr:D-glycerate dehydrogenase [Staphylococcus pasteuri]MCO0862216.1 D-glycerate dehydrogenase [Staphylococcus pasteuri]UXR66879.1 D-glycerate dehydrogenase [Staphylococcus pasteuri]
MSKIVVTRQIPQKFIAQLEEIAEVEVWNEEFIPMPREKFLLSIKDATACFVTLSEKIDEICLNEAPNLKVVANMAVGFDNIDIDVAKQKGVTVTNTPEVLTETTAELGFTLMLATARRIVEAEQYIQEGQWKSWGPYLLSGKDVYGSTVGIFGMGDIGKAFAKRLKGFNTKIFYHNRSRQEATENELGATWVSFDELLEKSDFVVCTAPLTDETKHKFNASAFEKMKSDSIFINIGRGAVVNEEDLVNALNTGQLLACGLDVLEQEPIDMDHPLLKMPNAVILPHIGSASENTRNDMIQLCVDNIKAVLNDKPAITPVNS